MTATFAGGGWAQRTPLYLRDAWFTFLGEPVGPTFLADGLRFSVPLLLFLTVHEFGHFFAARRHRVPVSLPYFLPVPLPAPLSIGTLGAVIRLRAALPTTRALFDVGAAGPLAGFAVAVGVLVYALATLPPPTYLLDAGPGHELLQQYVRTYGRFPATPPGGGDPLTFATPPLFALLAAAFPNVPPGWELYHYPTLLAGWFGLLFTGLNLLPVGQFDGGHILYALAGPRWHRRIARGVVLALMASGALGAADLIDAAGETTLQTVLSWVALAAVLYALLRRILPGTAANLTLLLYVVAISLVLRLAPAVAAYAYLPWLLWAALFVFVIRVDHPPEYLRERLTPVRVVLGLLCFAILLLCASPQPLWGGA